MSTPLSRLVLTLAYFSATPSLINPTGLIQRPAGRTKRGLRASAATWINWLCTLALIRGLLFAIAIIITAYALTGGAFYLLYSINACITEVRQDGIVRASMQFQITETDCSTLGEDASISVYGLADSGGDRTLLFKYGPESYYLPLPMIEAPDRQTIIIAVPIVSSVDFQLDTWNSRSIRYDIGHIDYPRPAR